MVGLAKLFTNRFVARITKKQNHSRKSPPKYLKHEDLLLIKHPDFNEKWVQDRIAEDPSILGLGDLILKDKERNQPGAGRLDLLFQDPDSTLRYEVEIQLGKTDECHVAVQRFWTFRNGDFRHLN